jgi:RimJ/RimL family protein N-acetyltransferase
VWPVPAGLELSGDHVRLRALDPDTDAAALFAALDHDEVWAHLKQRPPSAEALRDLMAARATDPLWHVWLVSAGGRPVGTTSFLEVVPDDARLEIGWTAYARDVWGTAVNPETKLLLLGLAFDVLRAGRVQLKTDIRNHRSQRAIDRLGARYEGVLRRYQRRGDGSVRDTVLFSITAEDWPRVRAGLEARLSPG